MERHGYLYHLRHRLSLSHRRLEPPAPDRAHRRMVQGAMGAAARDVDLPRASVRTHQHLQQHLPGLPLPQRAARVDGGRAMHRDWTGVSHGITHFRLHRIRRKRRVGRGWLRASGRIGRRIGQAEDPARPGGSSPTPGSAGTCGAGSAGSSRASTSTGGNMAGAPVSTASRCNHTVRNSSTPATMPAGTSNQFEGENRQCGRAAPGRRLGCGIGSGRTNESVILAQAAAGARRVLGR